MLGGALDISGKNLAPPAQARIPMDKGIPRKAKADERPENGEGLSRLTGLVASVEKDLNMAHNVDLKFSVHKASGIIMVTVKDGSTGKVIREIPPREILNLAAKMEAMNGLIFDKKG